MKGTGVSTTRDREAGSVIEPPLQQRPDLLPQPDPSQPQPLIQAEGLGKRYGRKNWIHQGLNLEVHAGSVTALLGRNGVGKSTAIQCLLGLLPINAGKVTVLGRDPRKHRAETFREVAYVSEKRELLEDQTVRGLAEIVASVHGERFDRARFEALRERYRLSSKAKCKTLSKGQRARLLLALALVVNPRLLILDEPTSGLDVVVRDDFLEAIADFAADETRGVLLSSHMIEDVGRIADRVIVFRPGVEPWVGETEDLRGSCSRYLVRLAGVLPGGQRLTLPKGVLLLERDPRALTLISHGAGEHLEAALAESLPLAGIERQPASLRESFACLTQPTEEEVQ